MAKRMTATEKWDDPFFFDLTPEMKLLWIYILDKCNHAGIIDYNEKVACFLTGTNFTKAQVYEVFKTRLKVLSSGKWFISKFIEFQYGELQETNNAHKSVIAILKKEGANEGLTSPLQGDKDKDKDKDKDTDTEEKAEKELKICMEIALRDEKWVRLNDTNETELQEFNHKLEKEGIYYKVPIDYKTHFSRWKPKKQETKTEKGTLKHLKIS